MESQYRAVKPTLACYDCDPSCLTCQGMSRFDCVTCRPAHKFNENTCLTCKDQPGMAEHPDPMYPGCIEICGDGFNFGMVQCDDGNLVNGDGCDSKCFVEKGWACSGGSKFMPDSCRDVKAPTPRISLINRRNQIYIAFDEEVVLTEDLSKGPPKFTISVTGN
jgi:cysteine-rich repeat protein